MALVNEDFLRCTECGYPEFRKEEWYTFHRQVRARAAWEMSSELPPLEKRVVYLCASCGHELEK